jgi:hypothetical protein
MIKGLSDKRRLPRIGKVHLGIKVKNDKGNEYPTATDYFVVTEDDNTPASAVTAFKKVYGDNPKVINIILPSDDQNQVFSQFYKCYGKSRGLKCKGDGITAMAINENGEMIEKKCPCINLTGDAEKGIKKSCRQVASLQFLIPDVANIGVWQCDTGSVNSIIAINSSIELFKGVCGKIVGLPLKLSLNAQEVVVAGNKKTIHVLALNLNESLVNVMKRQQAVQSGGTPSVLLPSADDKPTDLYPDKDEETGDHLEATDADIPAEAIEEEPAPAKPASAPSAKPVTPAKATPAQPAKVTPASPAQPGQTPKQDDDIPLDSLLKEPEKPKEHICKKCGNLMVFTEGFVSKINPATKTTECPEGKPWGKISGWKCVPCNILVPNKK